MTYVHRINLDDPKHLKRVPGFVYQCFPILAHVRGSSATEILAKLKENKEYDIYGQRYMGLDILKLWRFFYETNPSDYLPKSQTKCTDICGAVPLVMLAYKHQYDTPYEYWRGDPNTRYMMNKRIEWMCQGADWATKWPTAQLREYVELATGSVTAYRCQAVGDSEFDKLPMQIRMYLLQTWVYHPSIRSPNMITDVTNWDHLAPPLYEPQLLNVGPSTADPWGVDVAGALTIGTNEPW